MEIRKTVKTAKKGIKNHKDNVTDFLNIRISLDFYRDCEDSYFSKYSAPRFKKIYAKINYFIYPTY